MIAEAGERKVSMFDKCEVCGDFVGDSWALLHPPALVPGEPGFPVLLCTRCAHAFVSMSESGELLRLARSQARADRRGGRRRR